MLTKLAQASGSRAKIRRSAGPGSYTARPMPVCCSSHRSLNRGVILAALVWIVGCSASDPLEAIRSQQAAGDVVGSLEPLRELLSERPDDREAQYLYGRALALAGQVGPAEWWLREAMQDPSWLLPAGRQLAIGALATGNYRTALETTDRILAAHPDDVDTLLMRANAYAHSRSDFEAALADAGRVLALDPGRIEAFEPRILALLGLERIDEVELAIEQLGERIDEAGSGDDDRAWHCATRALFAEESDDAELARTRWDACLDRYPSQANVVSGALEFHDARGEAGRSLEILRGALASEPTSRDVRNALAQRLRGAGAEREAEALLREATGSPHPTQASLAWFDLAKHHQDLGDFEAAADAAERAVDLARQTGVAQPQLLLEYADSLLLAGELERALAVADEMTLPAHQEVIRARVAQKRGRPRTALEHFEEAFRLWPDNPWARYYAALAAEAIGDFDRAVEAYRYSIRIAAGATDARTRLARLHLAEGKPEEALAMLRLQAQQAPLDREGELLSLRLWAQLGRMAEVQRQLARFRLGDPDQSGRAAAEAAQGVADRAGANAALATLEGWVSEGFELTEPRHAEALRALVRVAADAGRLELAEPPVRAAVAAHPEVAAFHEILGLWLERRGAGGEEIRRAFAHALELAPVSSRALVGLGHLMRNDDPERALHAFERAAVVDPSAAEPRRQIADLLVAMGRPEAAEKQLEALLELEPYDADAAARLAELRLARAADAEQTLELAHRAVRFGGGAGALELLSRVHQQRGEPEPAREAARRARALRERRAPGA